jgi:hypothetical protein
MDHSKITGKAVPVPVAGTVTVIEDPTLSERTVGSTTLWVKVS